MSSEEFIESAMKAHAQATEFLDELRGDPTQSGMYTAMTGLRMANDEALLNVLLAIHDELRRSNDLRHYQMLRTPKNGPGMRE